MLRTLAAIALLLCSLAISLSGEESGTIKHRFLAVDDGTLSLHHVDQRDPSRNWQVRFGKYCMDMQLIGQDRVLLAVGGGYKEFALADGAVVKEWPGAGGMMHSIERLPDGRTLLAGRGIPGLGHGVIVLDAEDQVVRRFAIAKVAWIRHLRSTPRETLIIAAANTVLECDLSGTVLWQASVRGNNFKAVELDAERVLVSCGPGGRTLRTIDHSGKVLETLDGSDLKQGAFCGFHSLPHGNRVVANWLGHGSRHNWLGLFEYDTQGAVVWSYGVPKSSFVEVLVLDGLDTGLLHHQRSGGRLTPCPANGEAVE